MAVAAGMVAAAVEVAAALVPVSRAVEVVSAVLEFSRAVEVVSAVLELSRAVEVVSAVLELSPALQVSAAGVATAVSAYIADVHFQTLLRLRLWWLRRLGLRNLLDMDTWLGLGEHLLG